MKVLVSPNGQNQYAENCANLHKKLYPSYHLTTKLDLGSLTCYYEKLIENSMFTFYIVGENDEVQGFAIFGNGLPSLKKILLRRPLSLTKFLLVHGVSIIGSIINRENHFQSVASVRLQSYVLSSKVTKKIRTTFLNKCSDQISLNIGLSVDQRNVRAIKHYEKNGFTLERTGKKKIFLVKYV